MTNDLTNVTEGQMSPESVKLMIQNAPLGDSEKTELLNLFETAGDTPEFWQKLTDTMTAVIERQKEELIADFDAIDEGTEAIKKKLRDKERELAAILNAELEKIDPWDFKAQEPAYAAFERGMDAAIAAAKAELDAFATKQTLGQ